MNSEKVLLVIDMQTDFVTGTLANMEAQAITEGIAGRIRECKEDGKKVLFTRDTHSDDYLDTQEGRMLPVVHCVKGKPGHELIDCLQPLASEEDILDKPAFGSMLLPEWIERKCGGVPEEIEVIGVCTDICVISNALILKAAFPETVVKVDSRLCAGVTPESHETALNAMKACQIIVE